MTHERFNRILNWTPGDECRRVTHDELGKFSGSYRDRPCPWPVAMLAQRLHWQGRTQEAYDMTARLS